MGIIYKDPVPDVHELLRLIQTNNIPQISRIIDHLDLHMTDELQRRREEQDQQEQNTNAFNAINNPEMFTVPANHQRENPSRMMDLLLWIFTTAVKNSRVSILELFATTNKRLSYIANGPANLIMMFFVYTFRTLSLPVFFFLMEYFGGIVDQEKLKVGIRELVLAMHFARLEHQDNKYEAGLQIFEKMSEFTNFQNDRFASHSLCMHCLWLSEDRLFTFLINDIQMRPSTFPINILGQYITTMMNTNPTYQAYKIKEILGPANIATSPFGYYRSLHKTLTWPSEKEAETTIRVVLDTVPDIQQLFVYVGDMEPPSMVLPLGIAVSQKNSLVVDELLNHGAPIDNQTLRQAKLSTTAIAWKLVRTCISISENNETLSADKIYSLFCLAVAHGSIGMLYALFDAGYDFHTFTLLDRGNFVSMIIDETGGNNGNNETNETTSNETVVPLWLDILDVVFRHGLPQDRILGTAALTKRANAISQILLLPSYNPVLDESALYGILKDSFTDQATKRNIFDRFVALHCVDPRGFALGYLLTDKPPEFLSYIEKLIPGIHFDETKNISTQLVQMFVRPQLHALLTASNTIIVKWLIQNTKEKSFVYFLSRYGPIVYSYWFAETLVQNRSMSKIFMYLSYLYKTNTHFNFPPTKILSTISNPSYAISFTEKRMLVTGFLLVYIREFKLEEVQTVSYLLENVRQMAESCVLEEDKLFDQSGMLAVVLNDDASIPFANKDEFEQWFSPDSTKYNKDWRQQRILQKMLQILRKFKKQQKDLFFLNNVVRGFAFELKEQEEKHVPPLFVRQVKKEIIPAEEEEATVVVANVVVIKKPSNNGGSSSSGPQL